MADNEQHKAPAPSGGCERVRETFWTCLSGECHGAGTCLQNGDTSAGMAPILSQQELLDRQLLEFVSNGDLAGVQTAILNGAHIEGPRSKLIVGFRRPLLLLAARGDADTRMAELLLDNLADANASNEDGWTPLFFAAQSGLLVLCELVLAHGADPRKPDRTGLNALDYARDLGVRRELERILAERGITAPRLKELASAPSCSRPIGSRRESIESYNFAVVVNAQDKTGRTALHIAAGEGLLHICQKILNREDFSAVNARDFLGQTALACAVKAGREDIVQEIRDAGGTL